jgi:hypothetical protein
VWCRRFCSFEFQPLQQELLSTGVQNSQAGFKLIKREYLVVAVRNSKERGFYELITGTSKDLASWQTSEPGFSKLSSDGHSTEHGDSYDGALPSFFGHEARHEARHHKHNE